MTIRMTWWTSWWTHNRHHFVLVFPIENFKVLIPIRPIVKRHYFIPPISAIKNYVMFNVSYAEKFKIAIEEYRDITAIEKNTRRTPISDQHD
jgi:hypothetical protein